jgi:aminoglycoside 6'-N-acetyltransferase
VTHLYTVLLDGVILAGPDREPVTALAWADGTILALGSDEQVRGISRGDSQMGRLDGAFVIPLGPGDQPVWPPEAVLEIGGPADLAILRDDPRRVPIEATRPVAVVRGGRAVSGSLPVSSDGLSIAIRPAIPEDAPAEAELEHGSAIHHASIDPDRWQVPTLDAVAASRRYWHGTDPRAAAFVAEAGGHVVGMVELWLRRPKDAANAQIARVRAHLSIVVAPEWRGHGVGTELMAAAEAWARTAGAERMTLGMDAANTGARRLYERLGYTVWGLELDKPIEPDRGGADGPDVVRNADGEVVPTLHGPRVVLRPLRPADREALIAVLEDPTVAQWWDSRGAAHSADELLAGSAGLTVWAVEVDGAFAGAIQAHEETDADYRHAGIDVFLGSSFQGRGLGTDAVRTLAEYLVDIRGHHRLTIDPAASNARAIRAYEKVGFRAVGVMRGYERGRDGTFHDGLLMDLLAGEIR